MKELLGITCTVILLAISPIAIAKQSSDAYPIEISDDWNIVLEKDGVKVEYKVQECNNPQVNNQVLVLFRFTNTTSDQVKTIYWSAKEFRNGNCANCDRIDAQEFVHSLTLSPEEVVEGDGSNKLDKRVYLFSHFIKLVPGMSEQTLTDFEFVNVNVESQQISND